MDIYEKKESWEKVNETGNGMIEFSKKEILQAMNNISDCIRMEKEDRQAIEQLNFSMLEMKKEQERQGEILATEVKITTAAKLAISRNVKSLVSYLCEKHNLSYRIWSKSIFSIINGNIKYSCNASSLGEIAREDTDKATKLSEFTGHNIEYYETTTRFRAIQTEARLNGGKRYDMETKHKNYIDRVIVYHIQTAKDWKTVTQEQISKEAIEMEMQETGKRI